MGVRLSPEGPIFPESLIEDFILGRVVIVCGAGVSMPQLPSFAALAERIREACGLEWEGGERVAQSAGRLEESLGALQRRLIRPERLYEATARALAPPPDPDLSNHDLVLRLSRDREGRVVLVTTNFDTLFERALARQTSPEAASAMSRAGQDLPAPGTAAFNGVIHLHGRLADEALSLPESRMVLTSAEYGDAYMRSGWAARFLFDLARTSTLVLVGYSAGDAPVRYLLNVLEADRLRFSDLKPVYALDGAAPGRESAVADRWSALAMPVLTYPVREAAGAPPNHGALWRDLAHLADIVENTVAERRRRAEAILAKPRNEATETDLQTLRWALRAGAQVEAAVLDSIADPDWWRSLVSDGLMDRHRAARLAAAWVARRWEDVATLRAFLRLGSQLGTVFAESLDWELRHTRLTAEPWQLAWRLLCRQVKQTHRDQDERVFAAVERLQGRQGLDADIRRLIAANTPSVRVSPPFGVSDREEDEPEAALRLGSLCYVSLEVPAWADAPALQSLTQDPRTDRIAALATDALLTALADGADAGVIGSAWWDLSDHQAPAIGGHEQNRLVHGLLPLTSLLASLTPRLVAADPLAARRLFARWRDSGRRLMTRLWLYSLLTDAYSADEAARGLLELSAPAFWSHKRDLVRVLAEKLGGCAPVLRSELEARILGEGPTLFADLEELPGRPDWRPDARDQETWLRLSMLRRSGALSAAAEARLAEVRARRGYLGDEPEERDLFSTWSISSVGPLGDAQPILDAEVPARVEVATTLMRSGDFEQQHAWSRFVETSPQGALDSLIVHAADDARAPLWRELLSRVGFSHRSDPAQAEAAKVWVELSLRHLEPATDAFLDAVVYPIATAFEAAVELDAPVRDDWWDRIWAAAERAPAPPRGDDDLTLDVLNSAGGRLAMALLKKVASETSAGAALHDATRARLARIATSDTEAGRVGRGALVREITIVHRAAPDIVADALHHRLIAVTPEGQALRVTMLQWSGLDAAASHALRDVVSLGVRESSAGSLAGINVVGKLLYPLLLARHRPDAPNFGVHTRDAAADLFASREETRVAALEYLDLWMKRLNGRDPATEWRDVVGPVLDSVWPQDRRLRSARYTPPLLSLMASAEDAFPEVVRWALPWLQPFERDWFSLHDLTDKLPILRQYPETLFQVLWAVAGPPFEGRSGELSTVLDAVMAERPALARDRRMQALEARTFRPSA